MKQRNEVKHKPNALRRWLIRAIWCFGATTLVGIILGGVLLFNIAKASAALNRQGQTNIYTKEQIDKFITSVLITVQNQPLNQEDAQADMVFIASFNAFEQRLTVVALDRDTMLEVEGYGQKTLGETYALGGPGLLVNAMNQNFELDLQSYACTDTNSMAAMIDLLGGIKADLTPDEADYINNALKENSGGVGSGQTTLTGMQSMVHAMDKLSGEAPFPNLSRSLTLIHSAILNMRKTATKEAMLPLLSLVFSSIRTNLDITTLHDLGYEILKAEEIEYNSLILPCEGSWETLEEAGEGLKVDIPRNAKLLWETLFHN